MRLSALLVSTLALGALGGITMNMSACNSCKVGAESCPCTGGGGCDPGLTCLSDTCVDENSQATGFASTEDEEEGSASSSSSSSASTDTSSSGESTDSTETTTGPILDSMETGTDGGACNIDGCSAIDVLFAIDGSGSMSEEINALVASQAFNRVVEALEEVNCDDIEYRIGVTNDNSPNFITGLSWAGANPWFDSTEMSSAEIQAAFSEAAPRVAPSGVPVGCEHVLTNASQLLVGDTTGFLRTDALLLLVLITDVDDYGAYDNSMGNTCGLGCTVTPQAVSDLYDNFVTLKGGDEKGVAAIVVAGDPNANGGQNFCGQPRSCGAPIEGYHATRLYDFASMLYMNNGATSNVCNGPQMVPTAIETALRDNIDLACQGFVPPG